VENYKIEFEVCPEDFEEWFGRSPIDEAEFLEFSKYCEKGLRNGHIDWRIVFDCAREAMKKR